MLVEAFISAAALSSAGLRQALQMSIDKAGTKWAEFMLTRTLPWYAEQKAVQGSHAAMTGVRLVSSDNPGKLFFQKRSYRWEAVSVGDVCLFIISGDELTDAFPINSSDEFDNVPSLISSLQGSADTANIKTKSGELRHGQTLLLMSDALAEWFLKSRENGFLPWKTLGSIKNEADFKHFINDLRARKLIKNDDVTALSITVGRKSA